MPYVMVDHCLLDDDTSMMESFGIPFIANVYCVGECDLKLIRDQMMSILTKRFDFKLVSLLSIVQTPLDESDLFDVVLSPEGSDHEASYDLQPNSIIQTKLLWKSKNIKEEYYGEEHDFFVVCFKIF